MKRRNVVPEDAMRRAAGWWERIDYCVLEREIGFQHPDIPEVRIMVQVWWHRDLEPEPYRFELSHYVHTPEQVRPYVPSSPYARTAVAAVERAIAAIMDQIERAKRAGHSPDPSWFLRRPAGA